MRDQLYNACLRDILVRSGSCHAVHGWLLRIVMHAHLAIRPERLNLCLSGEELFHMSMFLVTCALTFALPLGGGE